MNAHSERYTYNSEGWVCQDCETAPIDEYGCQSSMKSGEPICIDCCHCSDHDQCDNCEHWVEVHYNNQPESLAEIAIANQPAWEYKEDN
jgi:hypothetical protein